MRVYLSDVRPTVLEPLRVDMTGFDMENLETVVIYTSWRYKSFPFTRIFQITN